MILMTAAVNPEATLTAAIENDAIIYIPNFNTTLRLTFQRVFSYK